AAVTGVGHSSSVPLPSSTRNASDSSEWQWGTTPRRPASRLIQFRPARSEPAASPSTRSPSSSSGTSSRATTLEGRSPGSASSSSPTSASTSQGSSTRPSTQGQLSRTAFARGTPPYSKGGGGRR